ncbi:MAG TPA: twin-arginine translocation signal domain-containing protein [Candidatus Acidoferrales bacterium]|nr:twin-arginine translocation signal domain-containing protein [Candidatus Acidoferrales bacterium]
MTPTRRSFLQASAAAPLAAAAAPAAPPDAFTIARRHTIVRDQPAPDFFEGMLLGNGDIGVCVTVRPDAIGLHIGKLDVWDIRVSEDHIQYLKPFAAILGMWREAGDRAKQTGHPEATYLESNDPVMKEYTARMRSSYAKPWPRPWPCGTVWLHWDSRAVTVKRQALDIAAGLYTLETAVDDLRGHVTARRLECFVGWDSGHISVSGDLPVVSIAYYPRVDAQAQMPLPGLSAEGSEFRCDQRLPATVPGSEPDPRDRFFALRGRAAGEWRAAPADPQRLRAFLEPAAPGALRLDLALFTSLDDPAPARRAEREIASLSVQPVSAAREAAAKAWRGFWSHSAVEIDDRELERIWYHNQYFLACCLRPGKVAPGLFGNWSSGNIGTAWHGDYHMNYNTQQVFWGVFSSNHVEQHLPYVDLVERLMPVAEWNAREQFGLPGAYFPHSAYPVPSTVNAYPVPPWGYEICETPWTVQSLWWHYLYTLDRDFLKRAYPALKGAAVFVAAFVTREADGRYHIVPTVSPENWGSTVDFRLNRDCIVDLALTEFLFDAAIEASRVLGVDAAERERWSEIRAHLAPYPEIDGPHGRVWLDVPGAPAEWVYNVPATLAPVFPGEQVGLDRRTELLDLARRTARTIRLEGGNDLVWQPLARARLGMLDLKWFLREVRYCLLPNGVANDRCRQIGGRYRDETDFDFMMRMGIWTENLSLPAVLNECMLQSSGGVIRLFPNTQNLGPARFEKLRAVGAFLISAAWDGKRVTAARLYSEKGAEARVVSPWQTLRVTAAGRPVAAKKEGGVVRFATAAGAEYVLGE